MLWKQFMVSKYDVWYLLATRGEMKIAEVVKTLQKPKQYANIRKLIIQLQQEGYAKKKNQALTAVINEQTLIKIAIIIPSS